MEQQQQKERDAQRHEQEELELLQLRDRLLVEKDQKMKEDSLLRQQAIDRHLAEVRLGASRARHTQT